MPVHSEPDAGGKAAPTIGQNQFCLTDFAITRHSAKASHGVLLSMTALMIGLGRAISEGFGIWGMSRLKESGLSPSWWWVGHAVIFAGVAVLLATRWLPNRNTEFAVNLAPPLSSD